MNTTLRNLLGFTLLAAIVLAMACQCFGDVTAVGAAYQNSEGWTDLDANADIFFVDADAADDTKDGRMPFNLSFTGGTYDHTGNGSGERLLTSSGAFSGYTDTGADGSDYIYVTNASGGIATGYYRIDEKISNDAVTLVADAGLTADGTCNAASGPKLTVAAGEALLNDGDGDHLLLQRGDTWTDQIIGTPPSGADEDNMTLIGAYGTGARPEIASTAGLNCVNKVNIQAGGGYLAFIGLHLHPNNRADEDGGTGIRLIFNGGDGVVLIEDCLIDGYLDNITVTDDNANYPDLPDGLTVRRNVILNARRQVGQGNRALGLFVGHFSGLLMEENIFDHNGFSATIAGTTQDHNIYISDMVASSTFRRNISSRSCYHGIKLDVDSGSHQVHNNFFCQNNFGAQIGGGPSDGGPPNGYVGMYMEVYNNCWVEGVDNSSLAALGGVEVSNQRGGYFRNNFVGNRSASGSSFTAAGFNDAEDGAGLIDYTIDSNVIYEQRGLCKFTTPSAGIYSNVTISNNHFQAPNQTTAIDLISASSANMSEITWSNNTYFHGEADDTYTFVVDASPVSVATWQSAYEATATVSNLTSTYTAPTRNATSFATSKGYASYQAWIDDLVTQRRGDWDESIMAEAARDYVFEGFDMELCNPSSYKKVLILQ